MIDLPTGKLCDRCGKGLVYGEEHALDLMTVYPARLCHACHQAHDVWAMGTAEWVAVSRRRCEVEAAIHLGDHLTAGELSDDLIEAKRACLAAELAWLAEKPAVPAPAKEQP